jgi:hypothetical protein
MLKTAVIAVVLLFSYTGILSAGSRKEAPKRDLLSGMRGNKAELQYFFFQMPKGGDLHNHLDGSVYAETYFKIALDARMYLDTQTYRLYAADDPARPGNSIQLRPDMPGLHALYMLCIDHWSVRNFQHYSQRLPPDEFFFNTFGIFSAANGSTEYLITMLKELRARAAAENVLYLEIILTGPRIQSTVGADAELNKRFKVAIQEKDEGAMGCLLDEAYEAWEYNSAIQQDIADYIALVAQVHEAASAAAPEVVSLYQAYALRFAEPLPFLTQLYIDFKACAESSLLAGVNIVAAENGENALRDYWGHMEMFRYLKSRLPVKTSMHAGELRLGLVPPEELSYHINDAVFRAGADRIGHGVDIAFESSAESLLAYMAEQGIAVEINLTSNEFILGVKDDEHPVMLYHKNKVPLTLSTDDPGILRSNLAEQYALAAQRYPELSYEDFKQISFNGISYSFLPDSEKARLRAVLEQRFAAFERKMSKLNN